MMPYSRLIPSWRRFRASNSLEWPAVDMRKYVAVFKKAYRDIVSNHIMALAAGLSYYFVMSLFPLLILAAAIVAYLPIPHLFDQLVNSMAQFVPADSMGLVRAVLRDVLTRHKGSFLTVGILGTLWTASGGFAALIDSLNVAYDVPETRPIWKTRLVAIGLMFGTGTLFVIAVALMFVGPQFGFWLASKIHLSSEFARIWPTLRWVLSVAFMVLGVEFIFYWAPNVKQRFWATLPGAVIGVAFWIGTSYALGLYFRNFSHLNKTYGTLAAAIALMAWLYYSWFMILVGAEINSELLKAAGQGRLPLKQPPPEAIRVRAPWEADLRSDAEKAKDSAA
jgi:membrane protein